MFSFLPIILIHFNSFKFTSSLPKGSIISITKLLSDFGLSIILFFNDSMQQQKTFLNQNCDYCGSEPSSIYQIKNSKTGEIRAGVPLIYNGIDRVDNKIGYVYDNCITCCKTCNNMKHTHDSDFFLNHIKKIFEKKFV